MSRAVKNKNHSLTKLTKEGGAVELNIFGMDQVDHIGPGEVRAIMGVSTIMEKTAEASAKKALLAVLWGVYNNPECPENSTCFICSAYPQTIKTSDILVHGAEGWKILSFQNAGRAMIEKGLDVLFARMNQPSKVIPEWEDLEPYDAYEPIYKCLVANEPKYPEIIKLELWSLLYRLRMNTIKRWGGTLPQVGDG